MPCTKKKERRSANVSKRLQTELQSLVAFACYDSKEILQCWKSAKRKTIVDRLLNMYMPSTNSDFVLRCKGGGGKLQEGTFTMSRREQSLSDIQWYISFGYELGGLLVVV